MTDDDPDPGEVDPGDSDPEDRESGADPLAWSGPDGDEADSGDAGSRVGSGEADSGDAGSRRVGEVSRRGDEPTRDEGAPLSDLAASVEDRRDSSAGAVDGGRFEEQDVTPVDTDAVWERIEGDGTGTEFEGDAPAPEAADEPGKGADGEREERDVDASDYCKRCPYFSSPPEVRCTHPGTEIAEVLDVDRFRVVDCPKVRETERLERL